MKKLILSELLLLFLATTFMTDSPPPGWYQQSIPTNKLVTDIFFIDSLKGWATASSGQVYDSSKIIATTNGGSNWFVQFMRDTLILNAVQFLDINTGYATGGNGFIKVYKTINGGTLWQEIAGGFGTIAEDIFFINKDTGWIADSHGLGGLYKTTNGGLNWNQQLNNTYLPRKLFFINNDTGWVGTNDVNGRLFITTNSGLNWNLQYTSNFPIESLFFLSNLKGWLRGGTGNGVMYTTDGGFTWLNAQGNTAAGFDLRFVNDSIGYTGQGSFRIPKSTDGGKTWGYQNSSIQNNMSVYMFRNDTLKGWAGGTGIVRTDDGGGSIIYNGIKPSSTFVTAFELKQNYPNPFNPSTTIEFEVQKPSRITLKIFTIEGREVDELLDYEKFDAGYTYYADFNAGSLSSGVYLYQMTGWTLDKKEIFIDTKKMILLK